jgi:hypothetical protein
LAACAGLNAVEIYALLLVDGSEELTRLFMQPRGGSLMA